MAGADSILILLSADLHLKIVCCDDFFLSLGEVCLAC